MTFDHGSDAWQIHNESAFPTEDAIRCADCGKTHDPQHESASGWVAYGPDGAPLEEQILYCPRCDPDPGVPYGD